MNPIRTNKPVFFGDDGEVLKSGKIYIGQPNQWPLDFPKTVTLQDSAGSQFTAEQPLTTNNQGRIVYNGKSIIALVDGDYSILVRDRNGVTVGEGYTPFVENTIEESETTGITQVGLLLSDIKQFDVTPGETIRNVGKDSTLDGLGADWLVVSSTGSAADDVDLINFNNGTQGQRIKSQTYRKDIVESGQFIFDEPEVIVNSSDADSYRGTWTTIDISSVVPDEASSAIVRVNFRASYPSAGVAEKISALISVRKTGQLTNPTLAEGARIAAGQDSTNTNSDIGIDLAGEATVGLDFGATSEFDIYLVVNDPMSSSENTDPDLSISVIGYTINARDLI